MEFREWSNEKWKQNIERPCLSGFRIFPVALTVEPKTALKKLIETGK
jgi:oxygen-independent coproporphyrinogen-3 oxidase